MDELEKLSVTQEPQEEKNNLSSSSKESESENLEAIKEYLNKHDKSNTEEIQNDSLEAGDSKMDVDGSTAEPSVSNIGNGAQEPTSDLIQDFILDGPDSELEIDNELNSQTTLPTQSNKVSNSVALSVGSKVEARDFADQWYSAEIVEVDFDEMEVLVCYDNSSKKTEEWINVNSTRLRPESAEIKSRVVTDNIPNVEEQTEEVEPRVDETKMKPEVEATVNEEETTDNKPKTVFIVGEKCLARWRDNRRFIATIQSDLGNGSYEIIFDDGFHWKCTATRLSKFKDSGNVDSPCDSPVPGTGPNSTVPAPAYHKHLFDPARDYLGSKSERRELKRKLNIKEIFNIGQKKRKETPVKEEKPKTPKEKKPRILKKNVKVDIKKEVKLQNSAIPDAIASIIGTVASEGENNIVEKEIKEVLLDEMEAKLESTEKEGLSTVTTESSESEKKKIKPLETESTIVDSSQPSKIQDRTLVKSSIELSKPDRGHKVESQKDTDLVLSDADTQSAKLSDGEFDTFDRDMDESGDAKLSDDQDGKMSMDPIPEEDKLQNFEKPDGEKHEQVMDRIKEAINKLEDGLNRDLNEIRKVEIKEEVENPEVDPPIKLEIETSEIKKEINAVEPLIVKIKPSKKSKKTLKLKKKLRMLEQEKAVEIVKLNSELEQMKKQMDEIRMQVLMSQNKEASENFLLPGEWCCKWVNGEPVGTVVETEPDCRIEVLNKTALPRKAVEVQDKRLPEGWIKLMVRRSVGHSAGKWDVVLVSPDQRKFHTKTDMRHYLENNPNPELKAYEPALMDFAVHLKLARRMGWVQDDGTGVSRGNVGGAHGSGANVRGANLLPSRPLKRKKLMLKRGEKDRKIKKRKIEGRMGLPFSKYTMIDTSIPSTSEKSLLESSGNMSFNNTTLEDGYVYVGSLKVQVIDNLLRCPAEGCYKNFRNNTLLQMHIQHYHRELREMLGATPKVLDLAYARTMPTETETRPRHEPENKVIKVKLPRPHKRFEETKPKDVSYDHRDMSPSQYEPAKIPRSLDSPMMRQMMPNRPVRRPKVLLPVRRPDPVEPPLDQESIEDLQDYPPFSPIEPKVPVPPLEILDFEAAISTHTVSKPIELRRKHEKRKVFATISKAPLSEDEEMMGMNSDLETRSSFAGSGTPESKSMEPKNSEPTMQNLPMSPQSNEDSPMYMYTETGERVKLERMKREEIINCHCGFREEDGLMVQCELCLCWQHALCHNIQREADVPQKYTCSICLNPRRGRRSRRFLHDQDRMNEGLLPGARPSEPLRRSHDISGNLLLIADALQALRLKYYVATKKNHPKLYLWAKDWDTPEAAPGASMRQERSHYTELGVVTAGKENMPVRVDESASREDMHTPTGDEQEDRFGQREGSLSGHSLLSGLLGSPGGPALDMPISTSELERLAKSVQEQAESCAPAVSAPQPEAPIENSVCREKLLRHVQRCQAAIDARLDMLESEIIELESQDPSFEDDETADYFPRTKQTVRMLLRDLESLQQLGLIT